MFDKQRPILRELQILYDQTQIELDAVMKDRDQLKADYDILAYGLETLIDEEYIKHRQKILRQTKILLSEKNVQVLQVQQRKKDLADLTNRVMRAQCRRLWV